MLLLDNPVLRKELLSGLRSPRAFVVQLVYVVLVSLVVIPVWPDSGLDFREYQARGRTLFEFFTIGQFVVIALLAPAIAASGFAGEKERRVYDLIYTSPLRLSVIILGKLLATIFFLLLLILSSLPAMSVCFQLGGVSDIDVLAAYCFLFMAATACGLLGLWISALSDRSSQALMVSYLVVLPVVVAVSYLASSNPFFFETAFLPVMGVLLAGFGAFCFAAIRSALSRPYNPVGLGLEDERLQEQEFLQFDRDSFPENLLAPPRKDELIRDGANPIYEKELRSEIFGRGTLFIRIIILLGLLVSVGFILFIFQGQPHYFVYYLLAFAMLVAPAFSCGAFTLERERQTLDMLLATLITPTRFVLGKFLAVSRFTVILTGLLTVPLLQWLLLGDNRQAATDGGVAGWFALLEYRLPIAQALVSYLVIVVATVVLSCSIAMAISMTAVSTVEAMVKSYVLLAGTFAGSFVVFLVVRRYVGTEEAAPMAGTETLWLVFGAVVLALVAHAVVHGLRRRNPSGIVPNLVALLPLVAAGAGVVVLADRLTGIGSPEGVGERWENVLCLVSPFLASVEVTTSYARETQFMRAPVPPFWGYVASALMFSVATQAHIVLRWRQAMIVERNT